MKWIQAGAYLVQPTKQNIPVIEIFTDLKKPHPLALVYNPKQNHALLFRSKTLGIILDYLDSKSIECFNRATEVAVCEMDKNTQNVLHYYRIPIQRVQDQLDVQLLTKKVA